MNPAAIPPENPLSNVSSRRRVADRLLLHSHVQAVEQVTAHITRVRIDTTNLATPDSTPGQHVRVVVGNAPAPKDWVRGQMRTYSIWEHTATHLDLIVFDHGHDGPGARWARYVCPGHPVTFARPQGTLTARPSDSHVFIGEETAPVPFGAILRSLPADQPAHTILEVNGPADQLPLPDDVRWHYRHGRSAADSASLVEAVANTDLPAPGTAYLAGEARTIQAVRNHLVQDRG